MLDEVLNVWYVETHNVCNFDDDYNWRIDLHTNMFNGMVSILEEITTKEQQQGQQDLLPLTNDVGQWDIIYGDGLIYQYTEYHNMPQDDENDDGEDSKPRFNSCPALSYTASGKNDDDELAYLIR